MQASDIAFDRGQAGNHFVELALHAVEALSCRAKRARRKSRTSELSSITHSFDRALEPWWAMTDSNRRPSRCKRDALPAELIARRDAGQFSESRNPLPGLNLACFDAAIWIFSPVRGLRPSDAARDATEKVPKPTRRTSSPPFSASAMASNTASTALLASDFFISVLPLTASTSSFLFTIPPWASVRDQTTLARRRV